MKLYLNSKHLEVGINERPKINKLNNNINNNVYLIKRP